MNGRQEVEFYIHWKGYDKNERSWTLASQFEVDDPPVIEFYSKHPDKPRLGVKSPVKTTSLKRFLEKAGGKENVNSTKDAKAKNNGNEKQGGKKVVALEAEKPPAKKQKRKKSESDESDFVMEAAEDDKPSEDESDVESIELAGEEDENEDEAGTDVDVQLMDADEIGKSTEALSCATSRMLTFSLVEKPVKKNPGWGSKVKTVKKAPVNLFVFLTLVFVESSLDSPFAGAVISPESSLWVRVSISRPRSRI